MKSIICAGRKNRAAIPVSDGCASDCGKGNSFRLYFEVRNTLLLPAVSESVLSKRTGAVRPVSLVAYHNNEKKVNLNG